jgi:hypothetical protein
VIGGRKNLTAIIGLPVPSRVRGNVLGLLLLMLTVVVGVSGEHLLKELELRKCGGKE